MASSFLIDYFINKEIIRFTVLYERDSYYNNIIISVSEINIFIIKRKLPLTRPVIPNPLNVKLISFP